jgi:hypothetical protein
VLSLFAIGYFVTINRPTAAAAAQPHQGIEEKSNKADEDAGADPLAVWYVYAGSAVAGAAATGGAATETGTG